MTYLTTVAVILLGAALLLIGLKATTLTGALFIVLVVLGLIVAIADLLDLPKRSRRPVA
jgi:hypothetical protein